MKLRFQEVKTAAEKRITQKFDKPLVGKMVEPKVQSAGLVRSESIEKGS